MEKRTSSVAPGGQAPGGPVVAVATDGSRIIQRGTEVDVFGGHWREPKRLPMGDTSGLPDVWYAVSLGARFAARVDHTGWIDLWDVAAARRVQRLDPAPQLPLDLGMPLSGAAHETAASWGAPAFLSEDHLVTHHSEGVVVWEVPSGRPRCTLRDRAIRLARQTFGVGPGVAIVRSGSDTPGIHNATLLEFSTRDCQVRKRHLIPAREPVAVAGAGSAVFVFSQGGVRMRTESGTVQVVVSEVPLLPSALYASPDGQWVVWAGRDSTKPAEEVIGLWSRAGNRVSVLARLQQRASVLHVRLEGESVHAIDSDGRFFTWPIPGERGQPAPSSVVSADALAREEAILQLGLGQPQRALSALEHVTSPASRESNRFLQAYIHSLATDEDGDAFRARMAREGIPYAGTAMSLSPAEELTSAEVLGPALDMFLYWLEGAGPGARPESGVPLGLELALQLSESDDHETEALLLRRLHEVYPNNDAVNEQLSELHSE